VNGQRSLVTKAHFLHNTRVSSSKKQEDIDRAKDDGKMQGRCISHMEMLHVMLKYLEVYTNLDFICIATMPLELQAGIAIDTDTSDKVEDGAYVGAVTASVRRNNDLAQWRQHTPNQLLILNDLKLSKMSVDKINRFSLRPPEFLELSDNVGAYYRWFYISKKKIKSELPLYLSASLDSSWWVDVQQRQLGVRRKAFSEIIEWCE